MHTHMCVCHLTLIDCRHQGPSDTPYSGGVFTIAFRIPSQYPLVPPEVRFATPFFHPNVHFKSGEICLDILKTAWSPAWTLQSGMETEETAPQFHIHSL